MSYFVVMAVTSWEGEVKESGEVEKKRAVTSSSEVKVIAIESRTREEERQSWLLFTLKLVP